MDNYLYIDNKQIKLSDNLIDMLRNEINKQQILKDKKVGETFKINNYEFIILEHHNTTTSAILKNFLCKEDFGRTNNYITSPVRTHLLVFANIIEELIGKNNLVYTELDLTSEDGLKDYEEIYVKVSLLTLDQYRKYVHILDKYNLGKYWWLATPSSTPSHGECDYVKSVTPQGTLSNYICFQENSVRPFCVFNSSIFVN